MKFSLGVPLMHRGEDTGFLGGEDLAELAQAAERAGFDSVYVTEHPIPGDKWLSFGGHHALDPFVGLAVAAVDQPVRLITNLTVLPYRNPFLLAKTVATLDRVSNGRVTLGVGTGLPEARVLRDGRRLRGAQRAVRRVDRGVRAAWTGRERHLRRSPLLRPRRLGAAAVRDRFSSYTGAPTRWVPHSGRRSTKVLGS